ncbi:hypothetical protein [Ponticaulis sp.]|uniref:hypothetical protein n=1 Tax=Ponticaulis sp. TaxID=2020902 RepID=UPI000B75E67A|nr:hypothetical protein [Ponticaulis sp.]MAI91149.1 hypothetical protein [Ponticaulis sp.]OUX98464.1 MAG: hypothetical protein CBB65_11930 [Hyphomonadaceae bacterium TMED5]|tara:strand:- start:1190 stop:1687 length:498 start_codon:yes stop_codon:yes gene_type:complete
MKKFAGLILAASTLGLSACGFTPVYSTASNASEGSIQIAQIDGYSGHVLRRELLMLLRPGLPGVENGTLSVQYEEEVNDFAVLAAGQSARVNVTGSARYELTTSRGILRGTVESNVSSAPGDLAYDDITVRRDASARAAMEAAVLITEQLQLTSEDEGAYRPIRD